eukprot:4422306-Pleurochrysis_carterae.AAC.1
MLEGVIDAVGRGSNAVSAMRDDLASAKASEVQAVFGGALGYVQSFVHEQVEHLCVLQKRLVHIGASRASLEAIHASPVDGFADPSVAVLDSLAAQQTEARARMVEAVAEAEATISAFEAAAAPAHGLVMLTNAPPLDDVVAALRDELTPFKPTAVERLAF